MQTQVAAYYADGSDGRDPETRESRLLLTIGFAASATGRYMKEGQKSEIKCQSGAVLWRVVLVSQASWRANRQDRESKRQTKKVNQQKLVILATRSEIILPGYCFMHETV